MASWDDSPEAQRGVKKSVIRIEGYFRERGKGKEKKREVVGRDRLEISVGWFVFGP